MQTRKTSGPDDISTTMIVVAGEAETYERSVSSTADKEIVTLSKVSGTDNMEEYKIRIILFRKYKCKWCNKMS